MVRFLCKYYSFLCIFLFLFVLLPVSFAQVSFLDDQYQLGDSIYFTYCGANEVRVSCLEDVYLYSMSWDSCRMFGFDSNQLSCAEPSVVIRSDFIIGDYTIPINNYLNAIRKKTDSIHYMEASLTDAAKLLYAYSILEDAVKIDAILERLKVERSNEHKCWPAQECSLFQTAEILFYLSRAGINTSNRVYMDGILWVESQQNRNLNPDWDAFITGREGTTCSFRSNDRVIRNFNIDSSDQEVVTFDYTGGEELNVSCSDSFCVQIVDRFGDYKFSRCGNEDRSVSFKEYGGCWPNDTGVGCSVATTSRLLLVDGIYRDNYDEGKDWLMSIITPARIRAERVNDNEFFSNIYAYAVTGSELLRTWLYFSQNNDGSFGTSNNALLTLEVLRLFGDSNDEWVSDAISWVFRERPGEGWGNVLDDALMYEVFKLEDPLITIDPVLLYGEDASEFEFLLDIDGASNYTLNISSDTAVLISNSSSNTFLLDSFAYDDGYIFGLLSLNYTTFLEGELFLHERTIPYAFMKRPDISFYFEDYTVFHDEGDIVVSLDKTSAEMTCSFSFNQTVLDSTMRISSERELSFMYFLSGSTNVSIGVDYFCESALGDISGSHVFTIRQIDPPFSLGNLRPVANGPSIIPVFVGETDVIIEVLSENDLPYSVSLLTLDAFSIAEVPLCIAIEGISGDIEDTLVFSSEVYTLSMDVSFYYNDSYVDMCTVSIQNERSFTWLWIILIVLALGGGASYYYFAVSKKHVSQKKSVLPGNYREDLKDSAKKEDSDANASESGINDVSKTASKSSKKRGSKEKQLNHTVFAELLTAVDSALGVDEKTVKKDLKKQGYQKADILKALEDYQKNVSSALNPKDSSESTEGTSSEEKDVEKK